MLVSGATVLGVNPGTARVAISRMLAAGELEATGDGYRLRGHLLIRHARQDESRLGVTLDWDGTWQTRVVPADPRAARQRAALRKAMLSLRFAELREGVWLRPRNLPVGRLPEAERVAEEATIAIIGTVEQPTELVGQLWDLAGWARDAEALLEDLEPVQARLDDHDTDALEEAFVLAAATLRHLQADPLLPADLVGAGWPGPKLRSAQQHFEGQFRSVLRAWHRAQRSAGP